MAPKVLGAFHYCLLSFKSIATPKPRLIAALTPSLITTTEATANFLGKINGFNKYF
jgi:hypothetical protein